MAADPKQQQLEDGFKSSLDDALVVLKVLRPHCNTLDEAVDAVEAAQVSPAVMRLLLKEVTSQAKGR